MQTASPVEKPDYNITMGNLILGKEIHSCLFLSHQNCSFILLNDQYMENKLLYEMAWTLNLRTLMIPLRINF